MLSPYKQLYVYTGKVRNPPAEWKLWNLDEPDVEVQEPQAVSPEDPSPEDPSQAEPSQTEPWQAEPSQATEQSPEYLQQEQFPQTWEQHGQGDIPAPAEQYSQPENIPGPEQYVHQGHSEAYSFPAPMSQPTPQPQQFRETRPPQRFCLPHQAIVWQNVHRIYGVSMGILLMCMKFDSQETHSNITDLYKDVWLQNKGLPRRSTLELMDLCYHDSNFRGFGESVMAGQWRRRDLKAVINHWVAAREWPGDYYFSECRSGFETIRRKARELLNTNSSKFDNLWDTRRQSRRNNGFR